MLRNSLRNSIPSTGGSSMVRRHLTKIFAAANQRPAKKATRGFHIRKSCRLVWDFVMFGNKRHWMRTRMPGGVSLANYVGIS